MWTLKQKKISLCSLESHIQGCYKLQLQMAISATNQKELDQRKRKRETNRSNLMTLFEHLDLDMPKFSCTSFDFLIS